jgi:hypothetical protein
MNTLDNNKNDIEGWTSNLLGAISILRRAKTVQDVWDAFNDIEYDFEKLKEVIDSLDIPE